MWREKRQAFESEGTCRGEKLTNGASRAEIGQPRLESVEWGSAGCRPVGPVPFLTNCVASD